MTILPLWEDIEAKPENERSALEQFIYDNEPAGMPEARDWLRDLQKVLKEVTQANNDLDPEGL